MEAKKQLKAIKIKDWRFWYKLLAGTAVIAMVLAIYINDIVQIANLKHDVLNWFSNWKAQGGGTFDEFQTALNAEFGKFQRMNWISIVPAVMEEKGETYIENLRVSAGYGEYTIFNFSFFTTLSNVAVGVWFLVAAFKPLNEGKKGFTGYEPSLIVATTITVTMLIWVTLLMPGNVIGEKDITWFHWFSGVTQHVVFPLLLILYICLVWKPDHVFNNKDYMKKGWWKLIAVVLVYGIYILIRGEMRYQGGRPYETQYPYFFLRIHDAKLSGLPGPGWIWFFIVLILIIGICLGFSIAYNTIVLKTAKSTSKTKKMK